MPWWSWIVIWGVLVLGTIAMLVYFGVMLFKKSLSVFEALGELGEKLDLLDGQIDSLTEDRFEPAIFADREQLSDRVDRLAGERQLRRQIRRDSLVKRGKLLVKADAQQFSHLIKRT